MTSDMTGVGDADSPRDRARIVHLAGDRDPEIVGLLSDEDLAEILAHSDLLADPAVWSDPPPQLEDRTLAAIQAQVAAHRRTAPAVGDPNAELEAVTPAAGSAGGQPSVRAAASTQRPDGDRTADRWSTRLPAQGKPTAARGIFRRPAVLMAAAAVVGAVGLTAVVLLNQEEQRRFDIALSATGLAPNASGTATAVRTDSGWEIRLDAAGLPRLDGGRFYQAWLKNAEGRLVPVGSFNEGTDVVLWAGVSPQDYPVFTVTAEEADGDQTSSGQLVMTGTAVED
jgi:hypothetical protein